MVVIPAETQNPKQLKNPKLRSPNWGFEHLDFGSILDLVFKFRV
jgi:hypothetical protein